MATNIYGKEKIRILSLGTGEKQFTPVDVSDFNVMTAMSKKDEFMMNMDTYTADWYLNHTLPATDYLRL